METSATKGKFRGKRHHLKSIFGMVSVKRTPNAEEINAYAARTESIARGEQIPRTIGLKWKISKTNIPRIAAIEQLRLMLDHVPPENHVVIHRNKLYCVRMFFTIGAGSGSKVFIMRENLVDGSIERSANFVSRLEAKWYAERDRVVYISFYKPPSDYIE